MTRLFTLFAGLLIFAVAPAYATPDLVTPDVDADETAWAQFGDNLVMALQSDNDGLKISALHHIAQFGERLDVRDARFEMVRLFRDHKDQRVRMLALAALSKARDAWIADFLHRTARFEADAHMAGLIYHAALANERG